MTLREPGSGERRATERSFGGFLRSLLSGIPWSERAEAEEKVSIEAPPTGRFRVSNSNGRSRVSGEDRSDIQVTAMKSARAESVEAAERMLRDIRLVFTETPEGLDLEVEVPRKWNRRGCVNLCIRIPRKMQVWVAASNGRIEVNDIHGRVRARSTNGSASVTNVIGDIEVATTNAKVSCSCTCGKLTARSSNGKIEIESHNGSVDASTSNGLIKACVERVGDEGIQLATSNGRISLDLPENVDADVDIRVDNGIIRNHRVLGKVSRDSDGRVVGRLGAGGASIKLRTSNGSVSLH
jgi:hypothetical protein